MYAFNHSERTENDNTIANVYSSLPCSSVSPANWSADPLDHNRGDVRRLFYSTLNEYANNDTIITNNLLKTSENNLVTQ